MKDLYRKTQVLNYDEENIEIFSSHTLPELQQYIYETRLFDNIPLSDAGLLFDILGAEFKTVQKGAFIYKCCEYAENITILISGILYGVQFDDAGNRSIIQIYRPLDIIGLPLAFGFEALYMNIISSTNAAVLSFPAAHMNRLMESENISARRFFQNISAIQADSSIAVKTRISILPKKTIREKILYYLTKEAQYNKSLAFKIPFNRQDLADYLFVERTSLSHQLSRLKKEGYLDFIQNKFILNPEYFSPD